MPNLGVSILFCELSAPAVRTVTNFAKFITGGERQVGLSLYKRQTKIFCVFNIFVFSTE